MVAEAEARGPQASAGAEPVGLLTGADRARLIAAAAGAVALFYLLALGTLLLLGTYLFLGAIVALGAARVGMTRTILRMLSVPEELVRRIFRSLVLPRARETGTELSEAEAPRLFAAVDAVAARVGVRRPERVRLEAGANAYVRLHGYGTGRGKTTLGVGLDLLAGLSRAELEAVLAHEMAHALLVQRGMNHWLRKAIVRAWRLSRAVEEFAEERRESSGLPFSIRLARSWCLPLARTCGRLESEYSRQDEFAADRQAALVCGRELYARTLLKTEVVAGSGVTLSWHERLVHARRTRSFVTWLRERLSCDSEDEEELEAIAFSQAPPESGEYDSHPPLRARLAALPATPPAATVATGSALGLLGDADAAAERLLEQVEEQVAEEEAEETRRLVKAVQEGLSTPRRRYNTGIGLTLVFVGVLFHFTDLDGIAAAFALAGLGIAVFPWLRRTAPLPAPSIFYWEEAFHRREAGQVAALVGRAAPELAEFPAPPETLSRSGRAAYWSEQAYDALLRGEYERAVRATRSCRTDDPHCLEGLLCQAVSSAYYHDPEAWASALKVAVARVGLTGPVPWAAGWAFALAGNWPAAEGYTALAARKNPKEGRLWLYLAWMQWHQNRMCAALRSARRAVAAAPEETDARLILVRVLLDLVRPREALKEIQELEGIGRGWAARDFEQMLQRVRVHLLLGEAKEASEAARRFQEAHPEPQSVLALAGAYWGAWMPEEARATYERAVELAFLPNAWVKLAALAVERGDLGAARGALLTALDLTRETPPGETGTIPLLRTICRELAGLNGPPQRCSAWTAALDLRESPFHGRKIRLVTVAATEERARADAREFYGGLVPSGEFDRVLVRWEPALDSALDLALNAGPVQPGVCSATIE